MPGAEPLSAAETRALRLLTVCIAVIGIAAVAFDLLYLFVPAGLSPPQDFAAHIGAAYARTIPMPSVAVGATSFPRLSLAFQAGMWGAFFGGVFLLSKLGGGAAERSAFRRVVAGGAIVSLALILAPPTLSTDLYHYALFGRMVITRGLNPYVTPANALAGDPLLPLADWLELPTHYGPVFTGLSVIAAAIGADRPIATALAFKALATTFGGLAAWAVVKLAAQQRRSALLPLGLVVLNPLILIETAGSGHNEMVMMGLALAGLAVAGAGRPNLGFALLIGSVHVKWVTAALAGLAAIALVREAAGLRGRAIALGKLAAIAVGLTGALYLPVWAGRGVVAATRALLESRGNGEVQPSALFVFMAIAAGSVVVVVRSGRRHLLEMAALVCLAFVLFVFPFWLPWYLIPTLTSLAVGPFTRLNRGLFTIATAFSLFMMATWAHLVPH